VEARTIRSMVEADLPAVLDIYQKGIESRNKFKLYFLRCCQFSIPNAGLFLIDLLRSSLV